MVHIIEGRYLVQVPAGFPMLWAEVHEGVIVRARFGLSGQHCGVMTWEAFNKLPVKLSGTAFQMLVWQAAMEISVGETVSYAELARLIGRTGAQRAVAQALKRNPVVWRVPCHRIVRSDGQAGGFAFGENIKRQLLAWENKEIII